MCSQCEKPYEDDYVRPHGPRCPSAVPGLCVSCWAKFCAEAPGAIAWWECLMPEDGGPDDPYADERYVYSTGTYEAVA